MSSGFDDWQEFLGGKAGSADESPIDIVGSEYLCRIRGIDGPTVLNADFVPGITISGD